MSQKKISIIIPCYNEARTIAETLRRVCAVALGREKEIIVVDDGSTDGTAAIVQQTAECRLLVLKKNQGKGTALRAGFAVATGDYVVVQDADLEYNPGDLRLLLAAAETGARVVYGSRRLGKAKNEKAGLTYYAGGVFLTWLTNVLYGTHITDEPTGYKMFERSLLQTLPLTCTGFEFCPEVTARIARQGIPIVEVPIQYHPRNRAEGKKIRLKDGYIAVWTLLRFRFCRPELHVRDRLLLLTQAVDLDDQNLGFFHAWIVAAAARAHTVTVLAQRVGRHALPSNVTVHIMGPGTKWKRYVRLWWRCVREMPNHDAVFCHMAPEYALIVGPIARLHFRRIGLWYVHKSVTRRLRWALRLVNVVFTASSESFRVASTKVRIVGHGIPTDLFTPGLHPPEPTPFRLLAIGRVARAKGLHVVFAALAEARRRGMVDVRLTVVGEPFLPIDHAYLEELHALEKVLDIASCIDWRGSVSYADLPELYREHHALLHASETGSVDKVVLEALAAGLMVFSSSEAFTALLPARFRFEKGNATMLADALLANRPLGPDGEACERVRTEQDLGNLWNRLVEDLFLQDGRLLPSLPPASIPASAIVLTYNSGTTLQKTLDTLRPFQELLVVDGGSTDQTLSIAQAAGCRILPQQEGGAVGPIQDFSAVRMRAMAAARFDWIYMIDSDERATPRLLGVIDTVVRQNQPAAYWIDRRYVQGEETLHVAATYPNRQVRFFHRGVVRGYERRMHERPVLREGGDKKILDGWMLVPLDPVSVLRQKWVAQAHVLLSAHPPTSFADGIYYGGREMVQGIRHLLRALLFSLCRAPARLPFAYEWARLPYYWTAALGLWRASFVGRRSGDGRCEKEVS
ncbi:glycosyltransferase [Patescibacteria group bacterium]|nr:glycosyltransferase [Patescibacteria group bacterium]